MNAPLPAVQRGAMKARERRMRRAAIARRIRTCALEHVASLDWDALDQFPAWLGLPDEELVRLQRAVGAVLHASELRLWIDAASIGALRSALGEPLWQGLLRPPSSSSTVGLSSLAGRLDPSPHRIGETLARAGARVLLASLAPGPLQAVARELFAPISPAEMIEALAASVVTKAQALLDGKERA